MALTRSCGRLTVATFLALLMGQKVATVEQRLYEWCCPAAHKAGAAADGGRHDVFHAVVARGVAWWASTQMALALDATSVGARFVVLTVSVVYRGGAMPVAWTVLPANQPGAWRREWLRMLRQVRPAIPAAWTCAGPRRPRRVGALALPAHRAVGRHPLLRINQGAKSGRRASRAGIGCASSWATSARVGGAAGRRSSRRSAGWTVRCSRGGARATPTRGCC